MSSRRWMLVTGLVALAASATGCTTFTDADVVARVNDTEMSPQDLDQIMALIGLPAGGDAGATEADGARQAMTLWVQAQIVTQSLAAADVTIDEAQRAETLAGLSGQLPEFASLPEDMQNLLADYVAGGDLVPTVELSDAQLKAWLDGGPEATSVVCLSHILVADEATADDVAAQLDDGADFGQLATEFSTDPGSAAQGGLLGCSRIEEAVNAFDPTFVTAALSLGYGDISEPVATDFGWHIIRSDTYDDLGEQATAALASAVASGWAQFDSFVDSADIYVDPRYGTIDGADVVALDDVAPGA